MGIALDRFRQGQGQGAIIPDNEAQVRDPQAMPTLQKQLTKHALTEFWERVIAAVPDADEQRRRNQRKVLKQKLLDKVVKEASKLAEAAYEKEEICPSSCVPPVLSWPPHPPRWARRPDGKRHTTIWYRVPADAPAWAETHFVTF
jgi:hypothetical protein